MKYRWLLENSKKKQEKISMFDLFREVLKRVTSTNFDY